MRTLILCLLFFMPTTAQAERLALVIGNADFERAQDLPQTAADARAMADKLRSLGFRLIGDQAHVNLSRADMLRQVRMLEREASDGDEVVFYFSGHGIGGTQTNYLLPVNDSEIETREDVPDLAVDVSRILDRLPRKDTGINIVILDACRDNPLPTRAKSAYSEKGLARVSGGASNTVFLYAAKPGEQAYVSDTGRSYFTDALLSTIDAPGKNLSELIYNVQQQVLTATQSKPVPQTPWFEGVAKPYYFQAAVPLAGEADAWARAKNGDVPQLLNFLSAYPDGEFADTARTLITMKSGFVTRTIEDAEEAARRKEALRLKQLIAKGLAKE